MDQVISVTWWGGNMPGATLNNQNSSLLFGKSDVEVVPLGL